jgi:hypothetical protein
MEQGDALAPRFPAESRFDRDANQKPGTGLRPGANRQFQFPEYSEAKRFVKTP